MANEKENAVKIYNDLVAMLNEMDWSFEKFDEALVIKSGVQGDDLPIEFVIKVDPDKELVRFLSKLPFEVPEDKRVDIAIAACVANFYMISGNFDFSVETGETYFRMTQSFRGGVALTKELFEYVIFVSAQTIDEYNDKFFMICKNMLSLEQFMESLKND